MNPIEQIEAEKLAKDTVTRAEAFAILAEPVKSSTWDWISVICLAFLGLTQSGGLVWLFANESPKFSNLNYVFVSVVAWGSYGLAGFALREARQNRRRLEAALALLNLKKTHRQ